jgi:hypothetical protein
MKIVAAFLAVIGVLFSVFVVAAPAQPEVPRSIVYGCSGGFTGGGEGVTIRSDGAILDWSKLTYGDPFEESVIGSDPVAVRQLFAELDKIKFTSISYNKPGNMTCYVRSASHSVVWAHGDPSAPSLVVEFALRLKLLAVKVGSK